MYRLLFISAILLSACCYSQKKELIDTKVKVFYQKLEAAKRIPIQTIVTRFGDRNNVSMHSAEHFRIGDSLFFLHKSSWSNWSPLDLFDYNFKFYDCNEGFLFKSLDRYNFRFRRSKDKSGKTVLRSNYIKYRQNKMGITGKFKVEFIFDSTDNNLLEIHEQIVSRSPLPLPLIYDRYYISNSYFISKQREGSFDSIVNNVYSKDFGSNLVLNYSMRTIVKDAENLPKDFMYTNPDSIKPYKLPIKWEVESPNFLPYPLLPYNKNKASIFTKNDTSYLFYNKSNNPLGHTFSYHSRKSTINFDGLFLINSNNGIQDSLNIFNVYNAFNKIPILLIYLMNGVEMQRQYELKERVGANIFRLKSNLKDNSELEIEFSDSVLQEVRVVDSRKSKIIEQYQLEFTQVDDKEKKLAISENSSSNSLLEIKYRKFINDSFILNRLNKVDKPLRVLALWFKSCPSCIKSFPTLEKLSKEFQDKIYFLGINGVDKDSVSAAKFLARNGLHYENLIIDSELMRFYEINSYPKYFILDSQNNLLDLIEGYTGTLEQVVRKYVPSK